MNKEQAIEVLQMVEAHGLADEAKRMAIQALETISHLNNRPCEACEFHKENGCSQWDCVFDKILYGERGE